MTKPKAGERCGGRTPAVPLPDGTRLRVVQLLATGTNGGAQESVVSTVLRLDPSRHETHVISLSHGSTMARLQRLGYATEVIEEPSDVRSAELLAERLIQLNAQVLHAHMYRAEVVGVAALDIVEQRTGHRPYMVSTVHSSRFRSPADRELLERITPKINRLIAVSDAIVEKLVAEGRDTTAISRIYNGVDLERFDEATGGEAIRAELDIPADAPLAVVVGRLEPEKGHPTLIEAWPVVHHHFPSAHLLVVGEGSERDRLEGLAAAHLRAEICCASVHFLGRREDVPQILAAADVVVMPSYREAQGLAIVEALAANRPVIASNVGGIPEMIRSGENGMLVPSQDPSALASAIALLFRDRALADKLASAGHALVHEKFCVDDMLRDIEAIYLLAVGGTAGQVPDRHGVRSAHQ
ncbi:MAG: glycosyltransferase family 1 protein [Candidatus Aquidulcis sp.]|nr:MAG: glycosyltransferase family 1 protein [Candidatus Aquidulcis sp.]